MNILKKKNNYKKNKFIIYFIKKHYTIKNIPQYSILYYESTIKLNKNEKYFLNLIKKNCDFYHISNIKNFYENVLYNPFNYYIDNEFQIDRNYIKSFNITDNFISYIIKNQKTIKDILFFCYSIIDGIHKIIETYNISNNHY